MKFSIGDRVKIQSPKAYTNGHFGIVVALNCYDGSRVRVELDNGKGIYEYSPYSLIWVGRNYKMAREIKVNKEGNSMAISGNYIIATCRFLEGTNTTKDYNFALFDADRQVAVGDRVLVDSAGGFNVCSVTGLCTQEECREKGWAMPTKEVVCKVDFEAYYRRKEQRKAKEALKKQMDKMVKDNQELILYQAIADKNPEMAALLEKYKELNEV